MAFKAVLSRHGDKIAIQTGYNSVMVRMFHDTIPAKSRIYRGELNQWFLDLEYQEVAVKILERLGYLITWIDDPLPASNDSFAVLGLLPTAQWEVCQAAYKALALINHPDKGGNIDLMVYINTAFDKIKMAKGK